MRRIRPTRHWLTALLLALIALASAGAGHQPQAVGRQFQSQPHPVHGPRLIQAAYAQLPLTFEAAPGQPGHSASFRAHGRGYSLLLTPTEAVLGLNPAAGKPLAKGERGVGATGGLASMASLLPAVETAGYKDTKSAFADSPRSPPVVARWLAPRAASQSRRCRCSVVRVRLVGANRRARGWGMEALPGKVQYFIGHDPGRWRTNLATYGRVKYEGVYPGVDLVYYGSQQQLEYDFRVAPGASPGVIRLAVQGAEKLAVDPCGDLVLRAAGGTIRQRRPRLYQEGAGGRREIAGGYVLRGPHEVGFRVGAYDRRRPLIIDPVLVYSSFMGGSGPDQGASIAVGANGSVYVAGVTGYPSEFPTTSGSLQPVRGSKGVTAFVTKLDISPTGAAQVAYSTYLGGTGNSTAASIKVDAAGNAYVTGGTASPDFPTTPNAIQTRLPNSNSAAFVAKLDPTGALMYGTYLGGSGREIAHGIAVDGAGNAYVTGHTTSADFPVTTSAFQPRYGGNGDAFVTKIDPTRAGAAGLVYSTYLGGTSSDILVLGNGAVFPLGDDEAYDIAVDAAGNAYVTGTTDSPNFPVTANAFQRPYSPFLDAFVAKIDPTQAGAASLVYSTYLSGNAVTTDINNAIAASINPAGQIVAAYSVVTAEISYGIAVDGAGSAYVTGGTASRSFPTTAGAFQRSYGGKGDAFVAKIDPTQAGTASLVYSTYLGGSGEDDPYEIAVDATGSAYVTGGTSSPNFPATPSALQTKLALSSNGSPSIDAFVTKVGPTGGFLYYSTYLGGSGDDIGFSVAVDAAGGIYLTGTTESSDFPTTASAPDRSYAGAVGKSPGTTAGDVFIVKISQ